MSRVLVIHAHPYPSRSRACHAMLAAIRDLPDLDVRRLYERYPDFDIDHRAEQAALSAANLVVLLHPIYWYAPPALFKLWLERVLTRGWAYGPGATALHGKHCLWVACAGGDQDEYAAQAMHGRPFQDFTYSVEQTARFCGMHWLTPVVVLGAHRISDAELAAQAHALRARLHAVTSTASTSHAA